MYCGEKNLIFIYFLFINCMPRNKQIGQKMYNIPSFTNAHEFYQNEVAKPMKRRRTTHGDYT